MKTNFVHGKDGSLSTVLADILGHLRGRYYGAFHEKSEEDLHRKAQGCVVRIAGHLQHVEDSILPVLRKRGAESERDIEELEKDHRILGLHAHYLASQIRNADRAGAYGVARSFLAQLFHHVRRETVGTGRCAHALEVSDTERLRGLIDQDRAPDRAARGRTEVKLQREPPAGLRGE